MTQNGNEQAELVVVVHGLWVTGHFMVLLNLHLRRAGYRAVSFTYPSVRETLSENALRLASFTSAQAASRVHFVGHSLGGLLILQMLSGQRDPRTGRIVLLGSPYQDCYAARNFSVSPLGRELTGRSMREWLQQAKPRPGEGDEIGVIAGSRNIGLGQIFPGLPRPNDGTITVAETRMPGMRDHIVLPVSHSEMLLSRQVARQVCAFLRRGRFAHGEAAAAPASNP